MSKLDFFKNIYRRKKRLVIILGALFLILAVSISLAARPNQAEENGQVLGQALPIVSTVTIGHADDSLNSITTSGVVKADSRIDIVAQSAATVTGVFFDIGDSVTAGQVLSQLSSDVILSNFNNAATNFANTQASYSLTGQLVEETVRQAELNLSNAEEGVISAELALGAAADNLANARDFNHKNKLDTLNSGLVTYAGYLSSVDNALNQVNYVIKADGSSQLPGIAPTLAALSQQSLFDAQFSYIAAKASYDELRTIQITQQNIIPQLRNLVDTLALTKLALDDTIRVLDNTIPNSNFSQTSLSTQKGIYVGLRQSFVIEQGGANATLSSLENLDIINKRELDSLEAAYHIAQSQLTSANIAKNNALTAFNSAKKIKEQQLLSSGISLSAAQSQYNIAQSQLSNLTLNAPIAGTVTFKSLELGADLNLGQKVAEISQSDLVKVLVNLSSDDVYRLELGQPVIINGTLPGTLHTIAPAADPITRKVGIEILYLNQDIKLIPETFVDVTLPLVQNNTHSGQAPSDDLTIFIPLKSLIITQTEEFVFVYRDGLAKKILVTTGDIQGDAIQITSGLNSGDQLITSGHKNLEPDQAVALN